MSQRDLKRACLVLAVWLPASLAGAAEPSFDYDRNRPLAVAAGEAALRSIAYARLSGERAEAIVVAPARAGRHPGVLFVHWYGEPFQTSSRAQFLPDALRLARHGVVSLLVDAVWSDPRWFPTRNPADDYATSVAQVKELRRALDLLVSLPEVDGRSLGVVGHDFGAMYGTLAAAADRRPKAFVFIAGAAAFSEWFLLGRTLDAAARARVQEELAPLDPVRHIARLAPAAVLFQFARKDEYVPPRAADALVAAAKEPKTVKLYDCGHEMNGEAMEDRIPWLLQALGAAGR